MNGRLSHTRRGVLLLLVLALLALFGMVAVAFVIVSGQAQRSAKIMQRIDQTFDPPEEILNEAMMQVARGPSNPVSVVGPHSLLEDMYGNNHHFMVNAYEYFPEIGAVVPVAGGQILEMQVTFRDANYNIVTNPTILSSLSSQLHSRIGCVITILSGQVKGESSRIVGCNPTTNNLQMLALTGQYQPQGGDLILINAVPYSGTGFGYNPTTGRLDAWDLGPEGISNPPSPPWPYVLLPNPAAFAPNPSINYTDPVGPGGANEDYDAADYQNMALAAQVTDPGGHVTGVIPSMHRPALVNYWYNNYLNNEINSSWFNTYFWRNLPLTYDQKKEALLRPYGADCKWATGDENWYTKNDPYIMTHLDDVYKVAMNVVNFKRRIVLRPLPEDHPDFNGSNPTSRMSYFDSTATPFHLWECEGIGTNPNFRWDVDNDGDGVADSIWVDLGLPVRAGRDGHLYKPLFAVLCVDMDGRLNLNAHGSAAQTVSGYYGTPPDPAFPDNYFASHTSLPTARGRGFGPADINLNAILPIAPTNLYQQVLTGNGTVEGRYGSDGVAGVAGSAYFSNIGVLPDLFAPGSQGYNDYLSANKWFEFDGLYKNSAAQQPATGMKSLSNFKVNGELPDPVGKGVVGLDPAGRPILQSIWGGNYFDLPYEINLGPNTARGLPSPSGTPDNPFSPNELERILRPFDRDATTLPGRLAALTFDPSQNKSALIDKRQAVTTESWDVPVYSAGLPTHLHNRLQGDLSSFTADNNQIAQTWLHPRNITDVLKAYYYYQFVSSGILPNTAVTQANTTVNSMSYAQLTWLFPPEMLAGLKMNVNHPFPGPGTGASSDQDAYGQAALWRSVGVGGGYGDFWFGQMPDYPDGTSNSNVPFAARQQYARYLYVLALLLRDPNGQAQWFTETLSADDKENLTKRRIAQWAINAACFKVNDSIMVPFEYDLYPLYDTTTNQPNSWRVDGKIDTGSTDNSAYYRGLVWGCKPPELILTETLAFHDRRIADTAWDPDRKKLPHGQGEPEDADFDQTRIPQGSAFFELYCPRDIHDSNPPPDLYDASTNKLDLGRLAPADASGRQYPVWRLVIGASNLANPQNKPIDRFANNADTFVPQSQQYQDAPDYLQYSPSNDETSLLKSSSGTATITIDRIVWFANLQPVTKTANPTAYHADADRIYYNQPGTSALLERGHYAVIGPRRTTVLGLTNDKSDPINYPLGKPSSQVISLPAPNSSRVTDLGGTPDANIDPSKIKMPLGIVAANHPTSWSGTDTVGISISEPLFSDTTNYYPRPTVTGVGEYEVKDLNDNPIAEWYGDPKMTNPNPPPLSNGGYFLDNPLDNQSGKPLADENITAKFTPNFKTVFLQRLANPSAPYDPATNLYLTVDWLPIDLTVFNGDDNTDPYDTTGTYKFGTRQRGDRNAVAGNNHYYNIWAQCSDEPFDSTQESSAAYFDYNLAHSLGYLNQAFQPFITSASGRPAELYGDPLTKPFPWLPWFGRPYVSQLELLLVPAAHPARLLWEFQSCTTSANDYNPGDKNSAPFTELLNFLQSGDANGMNQFHRILDYVGVPSWFAGTEVQANPAAAASASPGTHTFFPPYNRISTYREPGRINLNTIYSQDVFNGLMNGVSSPKWFDPSQPSDFVRNRRGYGTSNNILEMDPSYPSQFGYPFRSSGGVFWSPFFAGSPEINATFMRPLNPTSPQDPLFQQYPQNLIPPQLQQDVNDTDRNPFFHYQDLMRLGNLVTTRSNVYAVWITVGYFEVKPYKDRTDSNYPNVTPIIDAAHPDGYELGQELGSDTGEIVRHRAFYMIDRTIPVGFQRGQDLNVEKAIILKRFIE